MSLQTRLTALASAVGAEIKALKNGKQDKVTSQGGVVLRDPVFSYFNGTVGTTDNIVVVTNLPFTGAMTHFRVSVSTLSNGHVDGTLSLYHYAINSGTIYSPFWNSLGNLDITVQLAKTAGNKLVMIFNPAGTFDYVHLTIWDSENANGLFADADFTGWSTSFMSDAAVASAYSTSLVTVPGRRVVQELDGKAAISHTHVATTDLTATGTKNTTTFLRGDNTWATPVDTDTTYSAQTQAEAENSSDVTARLTTGTRLYQAIAKWAVLLAGTQTIAGAKTFTIPPAIAAISTGTPATDAGDGAMWYDTDDTGGTQTDAAALTTGTLAIGRLPTTVVHRVVYTAGAWPARPTGATYVEWVGPVAPGAMTTNDTFWSTA